MTFAEALKQQSPLLLPCAHDALTARLIEHSGRFAAFQVGGFALDATAEALPDIGLRGYDAQRPYVERIIAASGLPCLVDADTAGLDAKSVARIVAGYERIGAAALFIEDQKPPKRCGHMAGKEVISIAEMVWKIKAACAAKSTDCFLIARTDALGPLGIDAAIQRALWYSDGGADGVYVDGIETDEQLEAIGTRLETRCLATSVLEGGGKTPWHPPAWFGERGYSMLLYPTTVLFRMATAIANALDLLANGAAQLNADRLGEFEQLLGLPAWQAIETAYSAKTDPPNGRD
jgi:2-methylisocitrate lyase-like PEP mutase family enzyme